MQSSVISCMACVATLFFASANTSADFSDIQYGAGVSGGYYKFNHDDKPESNATGVVPFLFVVYPLNRSLNIGSEFRYFTADAEKDHFHEHVTLFDLSVFAAYRVPLSRSFEMYPRVGLESGYATYKDRYKTTADGFLSETVDDSDLTIDAAVSAGFDLMYQQVRSPWSIGLNVTLRQSMGGEYQAILSGLKFQF